MIWLRTILIGAVILIYNTVSKCDESGDVNTLCRLYPQRVHALFSSLNLDYPGLEAARTAVEKNDWPSACSALIDYYRNGTTCQWLRMRPIPPSSNHVESADKIITDIFTFDNFTATQPRRKDGGLDWTYLGPRKDKEWGYSLNRFLMLPPLLAAYSQTGNPAYAAYFDYLIRDWIIANPCPSRKKNSVTWHPLNAGERMGSAWTEAFFGFQQSDAFTPAGRILMLSSLPEHANYLKKYHWTHHNHATMELFGLAKIALCWPEFKDSEQWIQYALDKTLAEIRYQVYPDGVQNELTSHYHRVALRQFDDFIVLLENSGKTIPPEMKNCVEMMYNYLAYSMIPNGLNTNNNDSNIDDNKPRLTIAAHRFNRKDWLYIMSNGTIGDKPLSLPSVVFPWAGQLISRSGWDKDAQWSFFDIGPWGNSHQHNDKLHISLYANGRDILIDSGRYWYKPDKWRRYFLSSASHNVILIDGKGQRRDSKVTTKPMENNYAILPEFDFAISTFDRGFDHMSFSKKDGLPRHTRALIYLRGNYWIVVDHIESNTSHEVSALWHFHPDCTVSAEGNSIVTTDEGKGNLRIIPIGNMSWKVDLIKGAEKPAIQGWYSDQYNEKVPNYTAVYTGNIHKDATFAWLLLPGRGKIPIPKVQVLPSPAGTLRIQVVTDGSETTEFAVRITGKETIPMSGDFVLDGSCAILRGDETPIVALGRIVDKNGKIISEHTFQPVSIPH